MSRLEVVSILSDDVIDLLDTDQKHNMSTAQDSESKPQPSTTPDPAQQTPASAEREEEGGAEHSPSWPVLLKDFTQDTTLHGIRYTTLDTHFRIRRWIWALMVLCSLCCYLYLVVIRIMYYLTYPISGSVDVRYLRAIEFPTVTICNENQFRMTKAAEGGWYPQVEQLLRRNEQPYICRQSEFACSDYLCISESQICDGFPDCTDLRDEHNCTSCQRLLVSSEASEAGVLSGRLFERVLLPAEKEAGQIQATSSPQLNISALDTSYKPTYISTTGSPLVFLEFRNDTGGWTFSDSRPGGDVLATCTNDTCTSDDVQGVNVTYDVMGSLVTMSLLCHVRDVIDTTPLLAVNGTANITRSEMYRTGAHNMEDMIESCTWKGKEDCLQEIEVRETDMGVCFTFDRDAATVELAGPGNGLSLDINVEQYDYTKNPAQGAGVKVLLHPNYDRPLMIERGLAVSAGLVSYLAVERTEVINLPPPWGKCASPRLKYYDHYSTATCKLDCQTDLLLQHCHCRDIYMTEVHLDIPVCSVDDYLTCAVEKISEAKENGTELCVCATPCEDKRFVPNLSFATKMEDANPTEPSALDRLDKLRERLLAARETRYRLRPEKYRVSIRRFYDLLSGLGRLEQVLSSARTHGDSQLATLLGTAALAKTDCLASSLVQDDVVRRMSDLLTAAQRLYSEMDDRVNVPLQQIHDYVNISLLNYPDWTSATRSNLNGAEDTEKKNLLERTHTEITDRSESMSRGARTVRHVTFSQFNAKYESLLTDMPQSYRLLDTYMTPLMPVLPDSNCTWCLTSESAMSDPSCHYWCNHTSDPLKQILSASLSVVSAKYRAEFLTIWQAIDDLIWQYKSDGKDLEDNYASNFYTSVTNMYGATTHTPIIPDPYQLLLTQFHQDLQIQVADMSELMMAVQEEVVEKMSEVSVLVEGIDRVFEPKCYEQMSKLLQEYDDTHLQLDQLLLQLAQYTTRYNQTLYHYLRSYENNTIQLSTVARLSDMDAMRGNVKESTDAIQSVLEEQSRRVHQLSRHISGFNFWMMAQHDDTYMNITDFWIQFQIQNPGFDCTFVSGEADPRLGRLTECVMLAELVDAHWAALLHLLDKERRLVQWQTRELLHNIDALDIYLEDYLRGNELSDDFNSKNFLKVEVFYKELTTKSVSQVKIYVIENLLGELGGFMGLLLGASVLTVVELLDLFIYNSATKCKNRNNKKVAPHSKGQYAADA